MNIRLDESEICEALVQYVKTKHGLDIESGAINLVDDDDDELGQVVYAVSPVSKPLTAEQA